MNLPDYECVRIAVDSAIAWITMARPATANALNTRMRMELVQAVEAAHADDAVRVIVIDGEGSAFCAGSDLAEIIPSSAHITRVREPNTRLLRILRCGGKPTIALMRGPAAGIGLAIALACDLRFATANTQLHTSFGRLGLTADGGLSWLLARTCGLGRAMEMLYTEAPVMAEQAERWGLLNAIVADHEIDARVRKVAERLTSRSAAALAAMKASMNEAGQLSFEEVLSREFDRQAQLMDGEAFQERFAKLPRRP
jgi:2-(1,2-epoxy-1,2-dihydrophenyl)acetyl-CoA isomerase